MKQTTPQCFARISAAALLAAGMLWFAPKGLARPYASGLTNNAGTISFRLNESADNVKIISGGGTVTNDLGALAAGPHTFALGISDPYEVVVYKVSPIGFTTAVAANRGAVLQISTDTDAVRFNEPRGLAVNTDPASPYFGRAYVANGAAGTATRPVGDGIYVFNSDLSDAVGQGNTARTGGLIFTNSTSPYRLSIGEDGNLYVADWSDSTGSLYMTDPDVTDGSGTNLLPGPVGSPFPVTTNRLHGSIAAAVVTGSLANGNLTAYVIDEDLQNDRTSATQTMRNSLWRYDFGSTLPAPESLPTFLHQGGSVDWIAFASQTMDLSRGTNGYLYVNDYRSVGSDRSGVTVLEPTGSNTLWTSREASRALTGNSGENDFLRATGGGAVSPRGDYLAVINIETNGITVVPLIDGIPDITNRLTFGGMGTVTGQGRDVAFDAAGNIYAVSSGARLLRVFSPGGTSTAITGSDGTFRVVVPSALVSVRVEDAEGYEAFTDTLSFRISRTGSTDQPLTVNYTLSGTATNSSDYVADVLSTTIPAGESSVLVTITPIDDSEAELTETVILTLAQAADYNIGLNSASGTISDNEYPLVIRITPVDTEAFERFPSDLLTYTVTRYGDTNTSQFVLIEFGGTATLDVDYARVNPESTLYIPEGVVSTNYSLAPIDDSGFEGDETVTLTLIPNDYIVGDPGTAQGSIRDDECPPETVLFADNLNANSSADWLVRFGANNGVADFSVDWAFDYSTMGIPSAPGSLGADTTGVRVTVNKNDNTLSSAGINLYPANRTFSGDFALRFDAFLSVGASNQTEHALAGVNHSGVNTNRVSQTPANHASTAGADGIWFAIDPAAGGAATRDYAAYSSTNAATVPALISTRTAASLSSLITRPPYRSAGAPGNASNSTTRSWASVEVSKVGNIVALAVNKALIMQVTNTYGFDSGHVMIGFNDQFESKGAAFNFAVFDNVRVVRLGINIVAVRKTANTVEIDFVSGDGGQASDFRVDSRASLSQPWGEVSANISAAGNVFTAVVQIDQQDTMRFYSIRR